MRVLFICGKGQILRAVDTIEKRLKGSVDLDRLESLDDLEDYFSRGKQFDKCVVLSPDRLIPNYSHDLLFGKMEEFKHTINAKCGSRVDILLCVVNDEDGCSLAEQFSDMSGMVTIIQVEEKLAISKMIDFIVAQGSTLAQKYKHYDLTSVLKSAAKERMSQTNNIEYKPLEELTDEVGEIEKDDTYITGVHLDSDLNMPSTNTDEDDFEVPDFNMNGFSDDFGSLGEDEGMDSMEDMFNINSSNKKDDIDLSDIDIPDVEIMDTQPEIKKDDVFNMFNDEDFETEDFKSDIFSEDDEKVLDKEEDIVEAKKDEPVLKDIKKSKLSLGKKKEVKESESELLNQTTEVKGDNKKVPFAKRPTGIKKVNDIKPIENVEESKPVEKKKKGIFGKKVSSDVDYEIDNGKNVKSGLKKPVSIPKDIKEVDTVEVSKAKKVGLKTIKKAPIKQVQHEIVEEKEENIDITSDNNDIDNDIVSEANYKINPQGALAAEELFELDNETSHMIEKGSGTGLNSSEVTGRGHKKRSQADKELADLLKPYLKHGGLLVFTGSHGTGKTVVASNIAHLLCKYGYRVCILDLDFKGKGQSYINLDTFRTVHGGFQMKMNSVNVANSTGTDFAKWTDVVKEGYHVITTTLNSDVDETFKLIHNENMGGLIRLLTKVYTFVIVDVDFQDLVNYYKDFANYADALIAVEESSQHGLTNFMLNMINIEDDEIENTMFNKISLVLNKEDGMKSFFGRKISSTNDLLVALDDTVTALAQEAINYSFTEIPVISILKYSNVYEKFWYTNKYISDTQDGEKIFSELLQNALTN